MNAQDVLIVGATTDERIIKAAETARARLPAARLHLLIPSGRHPPSSAAFHRIIETTSEFIHAEDIMNAGEYDVTVLAVAHTGRAEYPELVEQCVSTAKTCYLFSALGWQCLNIMDAGSGWPVAIAPGGGKMKKSFPAQCKSWVFFRPSDQTAHHIARHLKNKGASVTKVETLAALEEVLPGADAVFFDWCITHYNALFRAVQMAVDAGCRIEGLLSLDLADLAESQETSKRLVELNQSALPCLHHIHYLASREFILERYGLSSAIATPWWNQPDRDIWQSEKKKPARTGRKLHIVYHGLFYYWHEVTEFLPVLHELLARTPVRFDLFGRVHESLVIEGESLFPQKEQQVRNALTELAKLPGVCFNLFAPPVTIIQTMREADYYLGITAGKSLMSQTELRTGEEEAMAVGMRILRKSTPATELRGWRTGKDFLDIAASRPEEAVKAILEN